MNMTKHIAYIGIATQLLTAAPSAFAYIYTSPIDASRARCTEVAGRERDRCNFIHNRIERLRLRQSQNSYKRGQTLREQRSVAKNKPATNLRRIGNSDLIELRQRAHGGMNPRRAINRADEAARSACEGLESTEKYTCIRRELRQARQKLQ